MRKIKNRGRRGGGSITTTLTLTDGNMTDSGGSGYIYCNGGAVYVNGGGNLTLAADAKIAGCSAKNGGGVCSEISKMYSWDAGICGFICGFAQQK